MGGLRLMDEVGSGRTRLIYVLQRCFAAVESRKADLLSDVGLLPSHYALLMNVRARPGVIGAELARLLGVSPQNVAGLVARLIDKGLLERRTHELHPHVLELRLTDHGDTLLTAADRHVAALEQQIVDALGPADAEELKNRLEHLRRSVASTP